MGKTILTLHIRTAGFSQPSKYNKQKTKQRPQKRQKILVSPEVYFFSLHLSWFLVTQIQCRDVTIAFLLHSSNERGLLTMSLSQSFVLQRVSGLSWETAQQSWDISEPFSSRGNLIWHRFQTDDWMPQMTHLWGRLDRSQHVEESIAVLGVLTECDATSWTFFKDGVSIVWVACSSTLINDFVRWGAPKSVESVLPIRTKWERAKIAKQKQKIKMSSQTPHLFSCPLWDDSTRR